MSWFSCHIFESRLITNSYFASLELLFEVYRVFFCPSSNPTFLRLQASFRKWKKHWGDYNTMFMVEGKHQYTRLKGAMMWTEYSLALGLSHERGATIKHWVWFLCLLPAPRPVFFFSFFWGPALPSLFPGSLLKEVSKSKYPSLTFLFHNLKEAFGFYSGSDMAECTDNLVHSFKKNTWSDRRQVVKSEAIEIDTVVENHPRGASDSCASSNGELTGGYSHWTQDRSRISRQRNHHYRCNGSRTLLFASDRKIADYPSILQHLTSQPACHTIMQDESFLGR